MTLRLEIFPDDLDATVDFYSRVLRFVVTADQRSERAAYVSLKRGSVRVGAARGQFRAPMPRGCRPQAPSWCWRSTMSLVNVTGSWPRGGR